MKIKYSVIVPVYNSQKTLNRCIKSLITEKRDDIEIIMIDDGSKDDSGKMCDRFAAEYPQCRVIHKQNGGVSTARNTGIFQAQGEYILFVDSDDYAANHMFSLIDDELDQNTCDFIVFSYQQLGKQSVKTINRKSFAAINDTEMYDKIREIIANKEINAPWAKLYRRSLIAQYRVRFPEDIYVGEDKIFNTEYSIHINSLRMSDAVMYTVDVQNENSLSRARHPDLPEQFEKIDQAVQKIYRTCRTEEWKLQYYRDADVYLKYCKVYSAAKRMHLAGISLIKRYKAIYEKCSDMSGKSSWSPNSRFGRLIVFTVKHRMITVIDIMGRYLICKK